jgi:LysM repeat protein
MLAPKMGGYLQDFYIQRMPPHCTVMHVKKTALLATTAVALALPATAAANYAHVVAPGESLTSVAATDGISVSALAAANGLSAQAELIVGQVLQIPPQGVGVTSASSSSSVTAPTYAAASTSAGGVYMVQPGDTLSAIAARAGISPAHLAALNGISLNGILLAGRQLTLPDGASSSTSTSTSFVSTDTDSATASGGSYVVQLGDTLSAIAARSGTSVTHLAALNGLNPDGVLIAGTSLTLPSGSAAISETSGPATGSGNQQIPGDTNAGPYPTAESVSSSEVGSVAAGEGLSPSLAEAIGWQESGYNNDLTSSTGAVGVMQIEPATWSWINQVLTPGAPLSPSSAYDNVKGGVLLLHDLVAQTGSDSEAAAAYYQGLQSVREHGEYSDTQQYVADVAALQARFGGG